MTDVIKLPVDYREITQQQRRSVRQEYVRLQGGKCKHCGTSLSERPSERILAKPLNMRLFPVRFLDWPIHLHHDHKSGMTLGAVHAYCNGVLWQYHGE